MSTHQRKTWGHVLDEQLLTLEFGQILMGALSLQLIASLLAFFLKRPKVAIFGYALLAAAVAAACTALAIPPPTGNMTAFIVALLTGFFGYVLTIKSMKNRS